MSANPSTKKIDPLLAQVMAAIHNRVDAVPEGFRTLEQWAKHWGVARSSATTYVHKAMELGLMEKKRFTVSSRADSRAYPTDHFREKSKAKGRK